MSMTNLPDPAARKRVVAQDLAKHPAPAAGAAVAAAIAVSLSGARSAARGIRIPLLSPPLVITRSECDTLTEVPGKALAETVAKMTGRG